MSEPIKVSDEVMARLEGLYRDINNVVNGVKMVLNVPAGWVLDASKQAFVPPPDGMPVEPKPEVDPAKPEGEK